MAMETRVVDGWDGGWTWSRLQLDQMMSCLGVCRLINTLTTPILADAGAGPQERIREDAEVCGQQAAYLGRVLPFTNDRSSQVSLVWLSRGGESPFLSEPRWPLRSTLLDKYERGLSDPMA